MAKELSTGTVTIDLGDHVTLYTDDPGVLLRLELVTRTARHKLDATQARLDGGEPLVLAAWEVGTRRHPRA